MFSSDDEEEIAIMLKKTTKFDEKYGAPSPPNRNQQIQLKLEEEPPKNKIEKSNIKYIANKTSVKKNKKISGARERTHTRL